MVTLEILFRVIKWERKEKRYGGRILEGFFFFLFTNRSYSNLFKMKMDSSDVGYTSVGPLIRSFRLVDVVKVDLVAPGIRSS